MLALDADYSVAKRVDEHRGVPRFHDEMSHAADRRADFRDDSQTTANRSLKATLDRLSKRNFSVVRNALAITSFTAE